MDKKHTPGAGRSGQGGGKAEKPAAHSMLVALEQRLMYDAALATTLDTAHEQAQEAQEAPAPAQDAHAEGTQDAGGNEAAQTPVDAGNADHAAPSAADQPGNLADAQAEATHVAQAEADQHAAQALDEAHAPVQTVTPATSAATAPSGGEADQAGQRQDAPLTTGQAGQSHAQATGAAEPTVHAVSPVTEHAAADAKPAEATTTVTRTPSQEQVAASAIHADASGSTDHPADSSHDAAGTSHDLAQDQTHQAQDRTHQTQDQDPAVQDQTQKAQTGKDEGDHALPLDVASHEAEGKTVVVIDARVQNYEELAKGVDPGTVLVVVGAGEDGLAKVSKAMEDIGPVSSIQFLTHADPGDMTLGKDVLNASTISGEHQAVLSSWEARLTPDADILLYGCRVGEGEPGRAFIDTFAQVTKADVAASTDDTGTAAHDGDWNLEVTTGHIQSHLAIGADVLAAYTDILTSAPTLDGLGSIVIQPNTATAVVMAPGAMASDVDFGAGSWNGGSLAIVRSTGASAQDTYSATGTLGALTQGGALTVGGATIGTVSTNSGGRLTLTFGVNATTDMVNQAIDQLAYRNTSASPPDLVTLNWSISDGSNVTTTPAYVAVNDPVRNDAPVFTGLGNTISATEDSPAVLAPNVHVTDAELSSANGGLGNWSGATLQLDRSGTNSAADVFGATGPLSTLTAGGAVTVDGTAIGTVTQNSAGQLILTFNANATNTLVESAMQNITYTNTTNAPPASVTINWTMNDHNAGAQGTGGAGSAAGATVVSLTGSPDAPTLGAINPATVTEQTAGQLASALTVSDPDNPATWNGFTLSLSRQGGADTQDVFSGGGVLGTLTEGGSVTVSGQAIGTVTTNSGGQLLLTFNANANGTEMQTALRNIRYTNTADAPPSPVVMNWNLTDDTGLPAPTVNQTVNITAVNDPSTVTGLSAATATEQVALTLAPSLSLNDPDGLSTTWNGGFVQIARQGGANAQDTYLVAGSAVTAGTTIPLAGGTATVATNSGGTLTINFGTGVTGSDVQGLLRQIEYRNSSDAPTASLNLSWTIDDGPNAQTLQQAVTVAGVNDAPSLGFASNTVSATEQTAVRLNSALSASDPDNPANWSGATLTLARQGGASAQDQFSNTTGQNTSAIVEGGALTVAGVNIGTVDQNSAGQLSVTFNANATTARVTDALRDISYTNTSNAPPASAALQWTLADSQGAQGTATTTVNITAVNDVASYSGISATTITEQIPQALAPALAITDPDGLDASWSGGFVRITRQAGANAQDNFSMGGVALNDGDTIALSGGTATVTSGPTSTLQIGFGAGVTGSDVQGLLRQLEYTNTSNTPPASVTLRWSLDDGPNPTQTVDQAVSITAANDAPSLGFTSNTVSATEQTTVRLNSALSVSDPDSPANWSGATLTLARQGGASAQDQFSNTTGQNTSAIVEGGVLTVAGVNIGTITQNSAGQLSISFNANATTARVTDALQDISYTNTSDAPPSQAVLQWNLTDAGGAQGAATTAVNITGVNDVASYSGINAATVTEQTPQALAPALAISDPDGLGSSWSGGFVQLARQGGANAQDSFSISGVNLNAGDTIALTGGTASVAQGPTGTLTITFGAGITGTDVQGLLRQLEYQNTSDAPPASVTLTWSLDDGPNVTQTVNQAVSITTTPDAPVITGLGNTVAATEQTATQLTAIATLTDADTSVWTGATLTLARQGGASVQDQFGNTGNLGTLTEGTAFTVSGVNVGTVTQNSGGELQLTFNANATTARVQDAIRGLTYANAADAPPASAVLAWNLSDPDGTAANATTTVNITAVNDAFTTAGINAVNAVEQTWAALAPAFAISDPDGLSQSWTGGFLAVARQGSANAQDGFGTANAPFVQGSTITFSGGGTAAVSQASAGQLRIDFGAGVIGANVQDLVASLGYRNDSDTPPASVALAWTVNDGSFSQAPTQTITLTDVAEAQPAPGGGSGAETASAESTAPDMIQPPTVIQPPVAIIEAQVPVQPAFTIELPDAIQQTTQTVQTTALANTAEGGPQSTPSESGPPSTSSEAGPQAKTADQPSQAEGAATASDVAAQVTGTAQKTPGAPRVHGTPGTGGPAGPVVLAFPSGPELAGLPIAPGAPGLEGVEPAGPGVRYALPGQILEPLIQAGVPLQATLPGGVPLPAGASFDQAGLAITLVQPLTAPMSVILTPKGGPLGAPQVQVWLLVQPLPGAEAGTGQTPTGHAAPGIDHGATDKAGISSAQAGKAASGGMAGAGKAHAQQTLGEQFAQTGSQGMDKRAREIAASAAALTEKPT